MPYRTPRIFRGCDEAAEDMKRKGVRRALLVTDEGVEKHGLLVPIQEALQKRGIFYTVYDKTPQNPTIAAAEEAYAMFRKEKCDFLIAVGGGSPMDCAKGVCARVIKPKKTLLQMRGILKVHGRQPYFLAVPTTSGTGSEATVAAVLTDEKTHSKFTVLSFCLAPKQVLLDPVMTRTLPPAQTAETGLDALTHAVEAYIGRSTTKTTRRLAVSAVKGIRENLLPAFEDGENLSARKNMQTAAFEAGRAFTISYVGYVHAVAHSLGGKYNTPHGRTNATLLPIVLEVYGKSCRRRLARLARKSGVCSDPNDEACAKAFIEWIRKLNRLTGIPERVEISEKDIPQLAKNADREANPLYPVPKLMNAEALEEIYRLACAPLLLSKAELLSAQKEYFSTGITLPLSFRKRALSNLYSAIKAHEEEIHEAIKKDLGKGGMESYMCETGLTLSEISFMLKNLKKFSKKKRVKTPLAQFSSKSYTLPSPYGSVLIMSPWNYPFLLTMEPLADALAAGNTAIVKPSAYSPATSEIIRKILSETFPPELAAAVLGGRAENSELLDLDFDKIFFTGSMNVGREVMRRASERLIPVTLELGGKSPCVVTESANVKLAAKRIVFGKFLNCGQTCVAPDYILVHERVAQTLLSELKKQITVQFGNPLQNRDYGKIINEKHFHRLCALMDREKVAFGGKRDEKSLRIEPTLLYPVSWEGAVMQEEIFGPLLPVLTYSNEEELFDKIRSGKDPLAAYLFSSDREQIKKFTSRLSFGGGCVNDVVIHLATPYMGFGGVGESGMGSYHGKDGFECFSHRKSILEKKTWIDLPMRYQPYRKFYEKLIRKFLK